MNFGYESLKKNSEYSYVYKHGKVDGNSLFTVFFSFNEIKRVGISISKKVGKAHERNLIKRRLRVIIRDNFYLLPEGRDYIFVVKPKAKSCDFNEIKLSWIRLAKKLKERLN